MKKILLCLSALLLLMPLNIFAQGDQETFVSGETEQNDYPYQKIAGYLEEGNYTALAELFENEKIREEFYNSASEDEWFNFIKLRKNQLPELASSPRSLMHKSPAINKLTGFDSGAFKEGDKVKESDLKYLYTGDNKLLWSGGVNVAMPNRMISENNIFRLWVPNWGTYLNKPVGVEIIMERLYSDTGWDFQFKSSGRPFNLYLENSNQTAITLHFYENVDTSLTYVNGNQISLATEFEYLMFGAKGLTCEESTNEYIGAYNDSLKAYIAMNPSDYTSTTEHGYTVYHATKRNHNIKMVFNVKDLNEIKTIVGFTGSGNWKSGGDGSMLFELCFDSFGLLDKGYILNINPQGGIYNGELIIKGRQGEEVVVNDAQKENHVFKGWEPEKGDIKDNIYTFTNANDTITAIYEEEKYPIKYVLNGGINNLNNPATYTASQSITILDPNKPHYDFIAWQEGNKIPLNSKGEKTFTATWSPHKYPIKYELDGGKNDPDNPATYTIEDEINLKPASKDGYDFIGWKEGNIILKGSTGELVFTALYEEEKYPIKYILNGGNNHEENPSSYTIKDHVKFLEPKKEGLWKFKGWHEEEKHIQEIKPNSRKGAVVLEAKWSKTCDIKDKNCDGVITCDEAHGPGWIWNNDKKYCEYDGRRKVVNTAMLNISV